jgi:hypothetical protein
MYAYDHNVTARRQAAAFGAVLRIPDAQSAAAAAQAPAAPHAGQLARLGALLGTVAGATARGDDVAPALLELSAAAHGWIDELQQREAAA